MKRQALHTVKCNTSGEAGEEIWRWSLSGVKRLNAPSLCRGHTVPIVSESPNPTVKLWRRIQLNRAWCLRPLFSFNSSALVRILRPLFSVKSSGLVRILSEGVPRTNYALFGKFIWQVSFTDFRFLFKLQNSSVACVMAAVKRIMSCFACLLFSFSK